MEIFFASILQTQTNKTKCREAQYINTISVIRFFFFTNKLCGDNRRISTWIAEEAEKVQKTERPTKTKSYSVHNDMYTKGGKILCR